MNEYVNAIYNTRQPNALKELLEKKKKDLDEALLTVITDTDMATDEKITYASILLEEGADPNVRTAEHEPLLCWTIRSDKPDIVQLLLRFNVDVNAADEEGHMSLHYCADGGLHGMAETLLRHSADPNVKDEEGCIPLFLALYEKSWEMVEVLLAVSDISLTDDKGQTALHLVVDQYQHRLCPKALIRLIKMGADVNAQTFDGHATPLVLSSGYHDWDVMELLIKAGADVNLPAYGCHTVLNKVAGLSDGDEGPASPKERAHLIDVLIRAGADVDGSIHPEPTPLTDDRTPLTDAIFSRNCPIVRQLLQANCNGKVSRMESCVALLHHTYRDTKFTNFMQRSIKEDCVDCATFVFGEACRDSDLRKLFLTLSLLPQASVNGETIGLCRPPYSLFRLCRIAVRSSLPKGPTFLDAVDQLPLPFHVKDFIAFRK